MKKIAFFDIDGTMVNIPDGMLHPLEETKRVLKEFQEKDLLNYLWDVEFKEMMLTYLQI